MKNIEELLKYMPKEYEKEAKNSGAMQRAREIKSAKELLLLCLVYLYKGLSLMEVSVYASVESIAEISSVNFMKRFGKCGEWFRSIALKLEFAEKVGYGKPAVFDMFRIIAVDASDIVQKGALKLEYHLHYAYDIFNMRTVEYKFTNSKVGETLKNFSSFRSGDIVIADRIYGTMSSILHCMASGADYIFRLKHKAFLLYDESGTELKLNEKLLEASEAESVDFTAYFKKGKKLVPVRICAVKKNSAAIEKSKIRTKKLESKKQMIFSHESKFMSNYIVVATSLSPDIPSSDILELYRYRWQIELFFKRAKSLLQLGNLPNKKEENILAWLDGKMLCALLVELIQAEIVFSPQNQFEF
jgi:hypothetical protein